jgi:hypothetical protein
MPYKSNKKNKWVIVLIWLILITGSFGIFLYSLKNYLTNNKIDNTDIENNLKVYNQSNDLTKNQFEKFNTLVNSLNTTTPQDPNYTETLKSLNTFASDTDVLAKEITDSTKKLEENKENRSAEFKDQVAIGINKHLKLLSYLGNSSRLYYCVTLEFDQIDQNLASLKQKITNLNLTTDKNKYAVAILNLNSTLKSLKSDTSNWSSCFQKYEDQEFMKTIIKPMVDGASLYFEELQSLYNEMNTAVQNADQKKYDEVSKSLTEKNKNIPNLLIQNKNIPVDPNETDTNQANPDLLNAVFEKIGKDIIADVDALKEFSTSLSNLQEEILTSRK